MTFPYDNWRLKLDRDENPYQTSYFAHSAIRNMDFDELSRFPNYNKIKEKLSKLYNIDKNSLFLTNGVLGALKFVFEKYLDKNDEFYSYNPLPDYVLKSVKNFCKIRLIDYDFDFKFNYEEFLNGIDGAKIAYLSTPNTITGEYIPLDYIKWLIENKLNTLFVVDCSYIDFVEDASFLDFVELAKSHKNIILIKSYSSVYALSGLDCAVVVANDEVMDEIKKEVTVDEVNIISQNCLNSVLNDFKYLLELQKNNKNAKELLYKGLEDLNYKPYETNSNFILCDFKNNCDFCYEKLKKNGILTKIFSNNSTLSTHLKITIPKLSGVKYMLEVLAVKDILIFDFDEFVFKDEKLNISLEMLDGLEEKYDLVLLVKNSENEAKKALEDLGINKYFSYILTLSNFKKEADFILYSLQHIKNHCRYNSLKYFTASAENTMAANELKVETVGVLTGNNDNIMINNFKHLGVKTILNSTNEINDFLEKNSQSDNVNSQIVL